MVESSEPGVESSEPGVESAVVESPGPPSPVDDDPSCAVASEASGAGDRDVGEPHPPATKAWSMPR
jgi:hypothetical protein